MLMGLSSWAAIAFARVSGRLALFRSVGFEGAGYRPAGRLARSLMPVRRVIQHFGLH